MERKEFLERLQYLEQSAQSRYRVLLAFVSGMSVKEVSENLELAPSTVHGHLRRLCRDDLEVELVPGRFDEALRARLAKKIADHAPRYLDQPLNLPLSSDDTGNHRRTVLDSENGFMFVQALKNSGKIFLMISWFIHVFCLPDSDGIFHWFGTVVFPIGMLNGMGIWFGLWGTC